MQKRNLIVWFLLITGLLFAQDRGEREFNIGPGKKLKVDLNTGGDIEVRGWDKDLYHVSVRLDGDQEDYRVNYDESSRGLEIDVNARGYSGRGNDVSLTIRVPSKTDLELETMGGEVIIDGITGEIEGETMGGDLEFSNLSGEIEFTTMGGDIQVSDSHLEGEVKTMGGRVELNRVSGSLKGSSMGGDVVYSGKSSASAKASKEEEIRISTMGGAIRVDSAPAGANVSTMGGDIRIRSAAKYVRAKTMGGDINLDEVDGGAKASTMGGDITVRMIGDPGKGDRDIDLSSMGGDITLTVPAKLSMDFDVKLTYTKNSRRSYKIESDFPIKIDEKDEWDYSEGTPRKYIYGTGKTGDGKYKIKIETINGDIRILKGN